MRLSILTLAVVAVAVVGSSSVSFAQYNYGPYNNQPYNYGYNDNSASTAYGSYSRGIAAVIRAQGQKNLRDAQAAEELEEARAKYIENRMKATNTYFRMRSANRAYREAEEGPPPTSEELFRLAKIKAPDRLSPSELDPVSGQVNWPALLRDATFTPLRSDLNGMLSYWAENDNRLTIDQYSKMQNTIEALTETLKTVVDQAPPHTYVAARKFLDSMSYELQVSQGS
jgi:hypothetical protein